jgi:hypothetical protein
LCNLKIPGVSKFPVSTTRVRRGSAAVSIEQIPIWTQAIIIRAFRGCCYGEGYVKEARSKDSLGSEQGNAFTLKVESLLEEWSRQHVSVDGLHPEQSKKVIGDHEEDPSKDQDYQYVIFHAAHLLASYLYTGP